MAKYTAANFAKWLRNERSIASDPGSEPHSSVASAFFEWLRAEGFVEIAEEYGLAVETLLIVLSRHRKIAPGLPIVDGDDTEAWDFMTETGFRFELYHHRRK